MSTCVTLNRELDDLKRTLNLGALSDADSASLRAKWEGNKQTVEGIFAKTKAEIEIYSRALTNGEERYKTPTQLITPSPELQLAYTIQTQNNTQIKAVLEARLPQQEALIKRINTFLAALPIAVPNARSRCFGIGNLFTKTNALFALAAVGALVTTVGLASRGA